MALPTFALRKFQFPNGTNIICSSSQVSELLLCPVFLVESVSRLATVLTVTAPQGWSLPTCSWSWFHCSGNCSCCGAFCLYETSSTIVWSTSAPCRIERYTTIFKGSTDSVCTGSILSLRHSQFLTEKQSTWETPWTEEPGTLTVHVVATESGATKSLPAICAHGSDTHCLGSQSLGSHSGYSWMVLS